MIRTGWRGRLIKAYYSRRDLSAETKKLMIYYAMSYNEKDDVLSGALAMARLSTREDFDHCLNVAIFRDGGSSGQ